MHMLEIEKLIQMALEEDIAHGDLTTLALIDENAQSKGVFLSKAEGVIVGIDIAEAVFRYLDPDIVFKKIKNDGDNIKYGEDIAEVLGKTRCLLTGERLALNFMQRLSGVASKTRSIVDLIKDYPTQLVDTRKTTPGMRVLEKYAVRMGGAKNHRFGLYDGVMIKDNHIQAVGSIKKAISLAREKVPHTIKIEVEVENLAQLNEALEAKADIIMLDNMEIQVMKQAVDIVNGRALLEASGGINEANIAKVAQTGVDFISVGAITHGAISLDISFNLE